MSNFGQNLKTLMKEKRKTARSISKSTGIPESTLSEWASGREAKFNDSILKLSKFLGVSVERLLTAKEPEQEVMEEILNEFAGEFTTIHKGVYRLKVEKYTGKKGKDEGDE